MSRSGSSIRCGSGSRAPAFDEIPDDQDFQSVALYVTMGLFVGYAPLQLSKNPNPRMSDGDPPWLSIDLRVFKTNPGDKPTAEIEHPPRARGGGRLRLHPGRPRGLQRRLAPGQPPVRRPARRPGDEPAGAGHERRQRRSRLQLRDRARALRRAGGDRRGRRARLLPDVDDRLDGARVQPRRQLPPLRRRPHGDAAARPAGRRDQQRAVLRRAAQARHGGADRHDEPPHARGRRRHRGLRLLRLLAGRQPGRAPLPARAGRERPVQRADDPEGLRSIQELMRGLHQCLVAEIHYQLDPIQSGATPGSSDNLAQRNILFDFSDNPGTLRRPSRPPHLRAGAFADAAPPGRPGAGLPKTPPSAAGSTRTSSRSTGASCRGSRS